MRRYILLGLVCFFFWRFSAFWRAGLGRRTICCSGTRRDLSGSRKDDQKHIVKRSSTAWQERRNSLKAVAFLIARQTDLCTSLPLSTFSTTHIHPLIHIHHHCLFNIHTFISPPSTELYARPPILFSPMRLTKEIIRVESRCLCLLWGTLDLSWADVAFG